MQKIKNRDQYNNNIGTYRCVGTPSSYMSTAYVLNKTMNNKFKIALSNVPPNFSFNVKNRRFEV